MSQDYVQGINAHENKKIFESFDKVEDYLRFRNIAVGTYATVCKILNNPTALVDSDTIASGDSVFHLAASVKELEGEYGEIISRSSKNTIESTLRSASEISGGAIQYYVNNHEGQTYYFVTINPQDYEARWKWMNNSLSAIVMSYEEGNKEEYPNHLN